MHPVCISSITEQAWDDYLVRKAEEGCSPRAADTGVYPRFTSSARKPSAYGANGPTICDPTTIPPCSRSTAGSKGFATGRPDYADAKQPRPAIDAPSRRQLGIILCSALWALCGYPDKTHLTRNILDACPKPPQSSLHSQLRALFTAPDPKTARTILDGILTAYSDRAPHTVQRPENRFDDATAILGYPEPYRKRLRTTNIVERLNEEIRRREWVIRIFPNAASVQRLLGALLMEQAEVWSTWRKYFDMAATGNGSDPRRFAAD